MTSDPCVSLVVARLRGMGIIDDHDVKAICPACGLTETTRIVDKGSAYGSRWREPALKKFEAKLVDHTTLSPSFTGTCRACGETADIT